MQWRHLCTTKHVDVITHNSSIVSKQIETIVNRQTEATDVEFVCGGKLTRMIPEEHKIFKRDYTRRYFTNGERCMEEPLQFPPPMPNQTSSLFAKRCYDEVSFVYHIHKL